MGQGFGMAEGPRNVQASSIKLRCATRHALYSMPGKVGNPYWVEGDTWLTKLALQPLVAVLFGFR